MIETSVIYGRSNQVNAGGKSPSWLKNLHEDLNAWIFHYLSTVSGGKNLLIPSLYKKKDLFFWGGGE